MKQRRSRDPWTNQVVLLTFGVVMGGIVAAMYTAVGDITSKGVWLGGGNDRLQWETLVGGGVAILAAWVTVRRMQVQIDVTREIEADKRTRSARAARATLSLELANITDYAVECMRGLGEVFYCRDPQGEINGVAAEEVAKNWMAPNVPTAGLEVFRKCIEYAQDDAADHLIALLRHLQVQNSRMLFFFSMLRSEEIFIFGREEVEDHLFDAAEVFARASCLYAYARGQDEGLTEQNQQDMEGALANGDLSHREFEYRSVVDWKPKDYLRR